MNEIKPGWATTEFWSAAAASAGALLTVAVVLFRVPPDTAAGLGQAVSSGLVGLGAALGAGWSIVTYIRSRVGIKQATVSAAAHVAMHPPANVDTPIPYRVPKGGMTVR